MALVQGGKGCPPFIWMAYVCMAYVCIIFALLFDLLPAGIPGLDIGISFV